MPSVTGAPDSWPLAATAKPKTMVARAVLSFAVKVRPAKQEPSVRSPVRSSVSSAVSPIMAVEATRLTPSVTPTTKRPTATTSTDPWPRRKRIP